MDTPSRLVPLLEQFDWACMRLINRMLGPDVDSGNGMPVAVAAMTDDEYLWEPVPGCWTVRPRPADGSGPGTAAFTVDFAWPEPAPPPVTTIAWRLAHINVGVLGMRVAGQFGGAPCSYETYPYPGTAKEALGQLDSVYHLWISGLRGLSADDLGRPCGPSEQYFPDAPLAQLVLHINREMLHHLAEIALLRDLYLWKES